MDRLTPLPLRMSDVLGPWPIKHRAHTVLQQSYLGARKGYAIAVPNLNVPITHQYWCDQTQPESRSDVESQFTATVMFSGDRNEAAVFASPEEAMTAFERRATPFLRTDPSWGTVSGKFRLMMFRLREHKTAQ